MLTIKALDDGSVYFEGFANKSVPDRIGDLIGKKAWKLDNYKKNPIILFNHDHSKPVGKMLKVEATEDGLFVKGRIANSKDPDISRVRDLVKEGILNSLSVGMRVEDEERKGDINHIKACELHEVSIVSVPMNQDSQFSLATKTAEILTAIAKDRGNDIAVKAISKLKDFETIDEATEQLAKLSHCDKELVHKFLRLDIEAPDVLKKWVTKGDDDMEEIEEEEQNEEDKGAQENVIAIRVPKEAFADQAELEKWAQESGWKTDNIEESETSYLLVQSENEGATSEVDLGDGVVAVVPAKEDGKAKNEDLASQYEQETSEAVGGEESNPPSWVTDEAAWTKAKEMSQAALGEIKYGFVVWAYHKLVSGKSADKDKGLLDDSNPMTQPVTGEPNANIEVNPALDQAKQTNVLLSNVVTLLQQLVEKVGSVQVTDQPKVEVEVETTEDDEAIKQLQGWMTKTGERLNKLGL